MVFLYKMNEYYSALVQRSPRYPEEKLVAEEKYFISFFLFFFLQGCYFPLAFMPYFRQLSKSSEEIPSPTDSDVSLLS